MKEARTLMEELERVAEKDGRFDPEAYYFIFRALDHTLKNLQRGRYGSQPSKDRHVSGHELLDGIRTLALEDFGLMAKVVLNHWGVVRTEDFGSIVFTLVQSRLMGKTDTDSAQDFANGYTFDEAFGPHAALEFRLEAE